jgi:hypothetical protein
MACGAVEEVTDGVGDVDVEVVEDSGEVDVGEVVVDVVGTVDGGEVVVDVDVVGVGGAVVDVTEVVGVGGLVVEVTDVVGVGGAVVDVTEVVDVGGLVVDVTDVVEVGGAVVDVTELVDVGGLVVDVTVVDDVVVGLDLTQSGQNSFVSSPASQVSPRSSSTMPLPQPSTHARPQNLNSASSTSTSRPDAARGGSKRSRNGIGTRGKKACSTLPLAPSTTNAAGFCSSSPPGALTMKSRTTVARVVPNAVAPSGGRYVLLGVSPTRSKR